MKEENSISPATLNDKTLHALSQVLQDIRTTVSHSSLPGISPLAVVDDTAVDALKDLFYTVNSEDPLNAMPVRRLIGEQHIVKSALLPLVAAIDGDPTSHRKRKRWSVCVYQTLRILSVLSIPITKDNEFLKPGCNLDLHFHKFRADIACNRPALHAFVSLLQYYINRKAEKQDALAPAEESQLEDARIDNILCFFRNILSPPRAQVGDDITLRDKGVHLALVGSLVDSDFYSTISILFSSKEDAAAQYTDLVFLVSDIYAQTYRHSNPREMHTFYKNKRCKENFIDVVDEHSKKGLSATTVPKSVFDETPEESTLKSTVQGQELLSSSGPGIGVPQKHKKQALARTKASKIRDALRRERAFIGGSRAITKSARWSSRFSGGLIAKSAARQNSPSQAPSTTGGGTEATNRSSSVLNVASKRVVSVRNAIQSKPSLNPRRSFQEAVKINSDILCRFAVKGRTQTMKSQKRKSFLADVMRKDLQEEGLKGMSTLTVELIDVCFQYLLPELRQRIEETKTRSFGDEAEALMRSQRSLLSLLGSVVGFQRERYGKVFKDTSGGSKPALSEVHENCMRSVLASDFKIVKTEWRAVEAGIELDTFRLVFRVLIESCESVKNDSKDDKKVRDVELSTFAVLQMMKMLQGMASKRNAAKDELEHQGNENEREGKTNDSNSLTPREVALNTIEQLFEEPAFLNAPADLAKEYSSKIYSFRHLSNIVEVTHAFTTILLDEQELAHLQVAKKKRVRKTANQKDGYSVETNEDKAKDSSASAQTLLTEEVSNHKTSSVGDQAVTEEGTVGEISAAGQGSKDKPAKAKVESHSNDSVKPEEPANDDLTTSKEDLSTSQKADEQANLADMAAADIFGEERAEPSDETKSDEPELQEVESIGIIRRFAHAKALQTLLLPLRAAVCNAASLAGTIHNVPEGSGPLLAPTVVAKSAHVVAAVWRVAKVKERGAMCGQFFTFGTMHLLGIVLEAMNTGIVLHNSVLERFSVFARDATRSFFSWLALSPGLTLDVFFPMDKASCHQYMTSARQRDAVLNDLNGAFDSGNESDVSALVINHPGDLDFEQSERRNSERKPRKRKGNQQFRRKVVERRRERAVIGEDEDVDDLDNLNLGNGFESSESEPEHDDTTLPDKDSAKEKVVADPQSEKEVPFCRLRAAKRRRASRERFDPFASDDDVLVGKMRRKSRKEPKKVERTRKEKKQIKQPEKVFYSSDEYAEGDLNLTDSERDVSLPGELDGPRADRRIRQISRQTNSEESDDSGAALETTIREAVGKEASTKHAELHHSSAVSEENSNDANSDAEKSPGVRFGKVQSKSQNGTGETPSIPDSKPSSRRPLKRRRVVLNDADSE